MGLASNSMGSAAKGVTPRFEPRVCGLPESPAHPRTYQGAHPLRTRNVNLSNTHSHS
jgi:hypothetical protein